MKHRKNPYLCAMCLGVCVCFWFVFLSSCDWWCSGVLKAVARYLSSQVRWFGYFVCRKRIENYNRENAEQNTLRKRDKLILCWASLFFRSKRHLLNFFWQKCDRLRYEISARKIEKKIIIIFGIFKYKRYQREEKKANPNKSHKQLLRFQIIFIAAWHLFLFFLSLRLISPKPY